MSTPLIGPIALGHGRTGSALALDNLSTDQITHGTGLGTGFTACSCSFWFYPTSLPGLRSIGSMSAGGPQISMSNDEVRVSWTRGGGGLNMVYVTNNADITVNRWWYVCLTVDTAGTAGALTKVYVGNEQAPATARTFGTNQDPSSGFASNSGATFRWGDSGTDSECLGGYRSLLIFWPGRVLTEAEAQQQQFASRAVIPGAQLDVLYGENGTGRQLDRSGYANHGTPSGCSVAASMPLHLRRVGSIYVPFTVAAAPAGAFPQIFRSRIFVPTIFRGAA